MVVALVIGNPFRKILLPLSKIGLADNLAVCWIASFATGTAVLALLSLWIGLFDGLIGYTSVLLIFIGALISNILLYRRELTAPRATLTRLGRMARLDDLWFLILYVGIGAFQMFPLIGLFVTPGDDPKLYSLITMRFIESGGIPSTWGVFADPSWYIERTHLLLPGFSAIVAFFVILLGPQIPSSLSVISSLFRFSSAASLYLFVNTVSHRRTYSLATMLTYGLLVMEPTSGWFNWGGMAELSSISLLPIAATGTYIVAAHQSVSRGTFLWTALVIGGMFLLHPFSPFYYAALLISVSLVATWKAGIVRGLRTWVPGLMGLGFASGPAVRAIQPELSISAYYSLTNPGWTPVFSYGMPLLTALGSLGGRFLAVYGFATSLFIGAVFLSMILLWERFRKGPWTLPLALVLCLWYALLFFLSENNPNGLLLVPFPLWYRIDSNRTFGITSFAVSIAVGITLGYWARGSGILKILGKETSRSLAHPRPERKRRLIILVGILTLITLQIIANANQLQISRNQSPISADDMAAFDWIKTQTATNATFFVNWADAGSWIPIYTSRRVILPFGVVTNYPLLNSYTSAVENFTVDPNSSQSRALIKTMGASYVYVGPGRIAGRSGFDPTKMISTTYLQIAYQYGAVWIFRTNQNV